MDEATGGGLTERDYAALARFRHALRLFLSFSEEAARAAGLTPQQHQLLLSVRGLGGAPSTSEIAEHLVLKNHSAVELIDRAEQAGLVVRATDPADARRQRISLTERGAELLAALTAEHRSELVRFRELTKALDDLG